MLIYFVSISFTLIVYYYLEKHHFFRKDISTVKQIIRFVTPFVLLMGMAMFREGIGVDYNGYLSIYKRIAVDSAVHVEPGFHWLIKGIQYVYDDPRLMFAISSFFTLLSFLIAIYYQSEHRLFCIILFIFMGYYNMTYNAIRYYWALSMVFLGYSALLNKKKKTFAFLVLIAATIHKTALIALVALFFISKRNIRQYILLILGALVAVFFRDQVREIAFMFYPGYENSVYDGGSASLYNVLKCLFIGGVSIMFYPTIKKDLKLLFYFKLNIVAAILYIFCSWIPELSRIAFYFNITHIIFLPNLIGALKSKNNKIILSVLVVILFFLYYILFMYQADAPTIHLRPYETWLF